MAIVELEAGSKAAEEQGRENMNRETGGGRGRRVRGCFGD